MLLKCKLFHYLQWRWWVEASAHLGKISMDLVRSYWANCVNIITRYQLVSKPFGLLMKRFKLPMSILNSSSISSYVLLSNLTNSRACTQQIRDSLLFLLIFTASAEIVSKINAPRIRTHNAIPSNDTDNYTERVCLEFK